MILKAGTRLKSAVCTTEVMVDRGAGGRGRADVRRRAGARHRRRTGERRDAEGARGGTQIGKRYVSAAGDLELLCTKPGEGSLAVGGAPLALKEAKPLPSSD